MTHISNKILIDHSPLEMDRNLSIQNCNNNRILVSNVKIEVEDDKSETVKIDRLKNKGNMNIMNSLYLEPGDVDLCMKLREQQAIREVRSLAVSRWLLQLPYIQDDDFSTTSLSTKVDSTESYSTDKFIDIHSESDKDTYIKYGGNAYYKKDCGRGGSNVVTNADITPVSKRRSIKNMLFPWRRNRLETTPSELSDPPIFKSYNIMDIQNIKNNLQFSKKWKDESCEEEFDGSGSNLNNIFNGNGNVNGDNKAPLRRTIKEAILKGKKVSDKSCDINEKGITNDNYKNLVLFNKLGIEHNKQQQTISNSSKKPNVNFHLKYNVPEQMLVPPTQQVFEDQNYNKTDIMNSIIGVNTKHLSLIKEETCTNNNNRTINEIDDDIDIDNDNEKKKSNEIVGEEMTTSIVPAPSGTWWLPNFCFGAISAELTMNRVEKEDQLSSSLCIKKIKYKRKIRHIKEINKRIKNVIKNIEFRYKLRKQIKACKGKPSLNRMRIEAKFLKIKRNHLKNINETSVTMKKMESVFSTGFPNLAMFSFPTTKNEYYDPTKSCASLSDLECCMWQQPMPLPPIGQVNRDAEILAYNYCQNWLWDYFLCFLRI